MKHKEKYDWLKAKTCPECGSKPGKPCMTNVLVHGWPKTGMKTIVTEMCHSNRRENKKHD